MAPRTTSALSKLPLVAKIGVGAGALVLVGVAYFVVFYGDIESQIKAAHGQEQSLRTDLADARKNEFAYQKDLTELTDRQHRQRELNKVLPTETEYPAFLSAVQSVANVSGIGLTAWAPQAEVTEQFYARVPMKVTLVGRYHQVAKFFYGVGQLDRIINMENISLTDPKLQGDDVVVKTEALATAFRSVADAKPTAADKRGAAMTGQQ
jgi:type IV pilus assembly protein PilO